MSEKQTAAASSNVWKMAVIGLLLIMIIGGGGAFWWLSRTALAAGERRVSAADSGTGIVSLEPFLVNLADKSGARFLRATLKLVVADERVAEHLSKNESAV